MSEQRHRDPILDPPRRKGLATSWVVGIGFSLAVNGGILIYVLNEKFKLIPYSYHDEKVNVTLEKLPPPPPPPKKQPPPPPKAPPPRVQPRETPPPPVNVPVPPPLNIKPVPKAERKEYTAPPVVTSAPPPPPAPHVSVISHPDWVHRPSGDDLVRFYPPAALERGTEGHSSMECVVTASGTLTGCHVVSESPSGSGFGAAELRLASRFKMRPQTVDGNAVEGGRVTIPMTWKVAG